MPRGCPVSRRRAQHHTSRGCGGWAGPARPANRTGRGDQPWDSGRPIGGRRDSRGLRQGLLGDDQCPEKGTNQGDPLVGINRLGVDVRQHPSKRERQDEHRNGVGTQVGAHQTLILQL